MAAGSGKQPDAGAGEALRAAIERTLSVAGRQARAGTAGLTRERATQLLDEVAKLGREASGELARRGQGARAELARRGQDAADEMAQRLESLERRLASLEDSLRGRERSESKRKPKAQG